MRDHKYRAQDKNNGDIWLYFSLGDLVCGTASFLSDKDGAEYKNWCEFTGLKDKNGKEIFESDVIHCISDTFPAVVVFDEKGLCWSVQLYHHGVKNELMTLGRYIYSRERAVREKIEVIGNIHETPELLEE